MAVLRFTTISKEQAAIALKEESAKWLNVIRTAAIKRLVVDGKSVYEEPMF